MLRSRLLLASLLALAFVSLINCAAWQKNPGAVLATGFSCALSIANDVAQAVHAGQGHAWVDAAASSLAGVQDVMGCVRQVQQLEQAAHGCASSEGPACASGAMPAEEQQRLDQLPDIGRAVAAARAYVRH